MDTGTFPRAQGRGKTRADNFHEAATLAAVAEGMCQLLNEGNDASTSSAIAIAEVLRERLAALADAMDDAGRPSVVA